jgi:hypothetical protein
MPIAIRIPPRPADAAAHRLPKTLLPALGLLALGACSTPETGAGSGTWSPFASTRNTVTVDSLTVQRVRGANPEFVPVTPEPGNVWPAQEGPRPTLLGSPEEAMQNIPEYRPSLIQGAPPARSPISGPPERGLPGSGATTTAPIPLPTAPRATAQPPGLPVTPPPPRPEGRALTTPSGQPAIGTGQAGNIQGFTQPGGGGGAVIRDGNVETWIGPDGQTRTRVVPPGQR